MPASPASTSVQARLTLATLAVLASSTLGMTACAAPSSVARVMIEFGVPTAGDAPDWLARLQQRSGVTLRYATAVSPRRHVYELRCPPRDDQCETAIGKLREDPAILDIVPDALRLAHPVTP